MYSVGDSVVCPSMGAGRIVEIQRKEILGGRREYLTIQIAHSRMTVMLPVENAESRLRRVIPRSAVDEVLEVLRGRTGKLPERWHARSKYIQEKLGTGDIFDVADVVRDLAAREAKKSLSVGEKQAFTKARKILASELMYARDLNQDEAEILVMQALDPHVSPR